METQNGTSSSRGGGGQAEAIEVRFAEFCENVLSLSEETGEQAMKVLKESKHLLLTNLAALGSGSLEEAERYWFACICFVVKRLGEKSKDDQGPSLNDKRLTLCQIMRLAKLNFQDFFKELTQFIVKAGPILSRLYGAEWENKLEAKELQANFDHLIILSRFYKRVYKEHFLTHNANVKQSAVANQAVHPSDYHRFGWLLFLALRVHTFSRLKDLVTCTNGLISVLAILILHMPVRFRNFSLNDNPQLFVKRGDKGADLLASLCNKHDASEEELKKTMDITNNLIADIFKKKPCPAAECNSENLSGIDGDGLVYYEDLMDESSLRSSLSTIEKDYEDAIQMSELDERIFISDDDSILGSKSLSAVAVNITGTPRKLATMMTPTKKITPPLSSHWSPMPRTNRVIGSNCKITSTPVTDAMTTSKWLRTIISPHPSRPSARLERFLASCDKDVTDDVVRRAEIILEAIFPSSPSGERCVAGSLQSTNLMDNIWAEQRRKEALKLYFRVLEAMCVAESQILHAINLTSLLTNERFHRCMLACSAELVLATHKTVTMVFPAVLERTGITAFDLSKVIESFVRHEESLPRELRRHLNSLEERLLESMVWERGSSMYNSLIVARPSLSAEIHQLSLLAEPMPSLDSIAMHINFSGGLSSLPSAQRHDNAPGQNGDIRSPKRQCPDYRSVLVERNPFTSPVKDRLLAFSSLRSKLPPPALQSAFSSPTRPNPSGGGETCAETGISVFFSKISKLAAVRINGMVEKLQPSQQHIRENTYRLFQQILSHRTSLFFNRHIDQIILCCFYGIAKISKVNLTFKEIVNNYRKQPQCKPQVFRCVFVDWSSANHYARTGQGHLDIIGFYNEVFVPAAKSLLVEVGSAGISTAPEVNNNKDGPCPASPASPFPSLPDMSPKKVSAGHNVYVSPLRTAKMDSLISQGSKSYYACVGESTQAFQSPSKDLTDINNRLNGGRKIRAALHFNDPEVGLVSDSMVANTLYLRNGSCESPSGTTTKLEQPDS